MTRVQIRYRVEVVSRSSGTKLVLWRKVGTGPERAIGGTRGEHQTREQVAATLDAARRADRAACTRLEVEADITVL